MFKYKVVVITPTINFDLKIVCDKVVAHPAMKVTKFMVKREDGKWVTVAMVPTELSIIIKEQNG